MDDLGRMPHAVALELGQRLLGDQPVSANVLGGQATRRDQVLDLAHAHLEEGRR